MIFPDQLQITDYPSEEPRSEESSETDVILKRVRLYARRRIIWLQHLWSQESSTAGQHVITHAAVESCLDNRDNPEHEQDFYRQNSEARILTGKIQDVENILQSASHYKINRLQTLFDLNEFESDLIQLCFIGAIDSQFRKLFAYLNDHAGQPYVTRTLGEKLFGYHPAEPRAGLMGSIQWNIINIENLHPGGPVMYELDDPIINWLSGSQQLGAEIASLAMEVPSHQPLKSWPVQKALDFLRSTETGSAKRLVVTGTAGSGRKTFAKHVIEKARRDMLCVYLSEQQADDDLILRIRRFARLRKKVIAWYEPDASVVPFLNKRSTQTPEVLISDTNYHTAAERNVPEEIVTIPALQIAQRERLWQQIFPVVKTWQPAEFKRLVTSYEVTIGEMHRVADLNPQHISQVMTQLNIRNHMYLNRLAENIPSAFLWEDLVVPDHINNILESMYYEARDRKPFWEEPTRQRLFPHGKGLLTLFTGPPGTGKTMAAQVLANRLHLQLYRIDLSTIVSKYVGETSKNLEEVIRQAQNLNVILFFDEADALFGKRTEISDAHDRFANTDTGFLLQAIEGYDGAAILASNKKGNIDQAFIRRLRYVVEFQAPDTALRQRIWDKLLSELLTKDNYAQLQAAVEQLSRSLELTGAQIKYAILSALFLARRGDGHVTIRHLLTGIERELMKNGQGLTAQQKDLIITNG